MIAKKEHIYANTAVSNHFYKYIISTDNVGDVNEHHVHNHNLKIQVECINLSTQSPLIKLKHLKYFIRYRCPKL